MQADLIVRSNCIVTCKESSKSEVLDGFIIVVDGKIKAVGEGEVPQEYLGPETAFIDVRGKTVVPGLIDAHTHLVHGGSREKELSLKLQGVPYLEILKRGGGILSTVRSTRSASKEELKAKARKSLDQMLLHGTTTVEAKSGYGLDLETEVRCLEVAGELNREHPIDILRTYMGAHAVPEEFKGDTWGYLKLMLKTVTGLIIL